jgi:hypothetical protein
MTMTDLKLLALDGEDLETISATTQDAVVRVSEMGYAKRDRRFAMLMNRFAWEESGKGAARTGVRKRSALHFERVLRARFTGFDPAAPEGAVELLAVQFTETNAPAGYVELTFAGGGAVRLDVECLEARLEDLGAAWAARIRPEHAA